MFADDDFANLFPRRGRPAPVTMLQFRGGFSCRRATDAVCSRIDLSCLLGSEVTDTGSDISVLSEFGSWLLAGADGELMLEKLLGRSQATGLLKT